MEYRFVDDNILAYIRQDQDEAFLVILNLGEEAAEVDFSTVQYKVCVFSMYFSLLKIRKNLILMC